MGINIYKKLNTVRVALSQLNLKKTGYNTFKNYKYFELGDFLPPLLQLCDQNGLCSIINFVQENQQATLTLINIDNPDEQLMFSVFLSGIKKPDNIKDIGSIETYARRYLLIMVFDIAENVVQESSEKTAVVEDSRDVLGKNKEYINVKKQEELENRSKKKGVPIEKILEKYKVSSIEELTVPDFTGIMTLLNRYPDAVAEVAEEGEHEVNG